MPPEEQKAAARLVRALVITAAATVVIAIVLGATVAAPLYAIAALAVVDLALAWAVQSGKLRLGRAGAAGD